MSCQRAGTARRPEKVPMGDLYEADVLEWAEHQAELLRQHAAGKPSNETPDWPNIIEEVESVGRSQLDLPRRREPRRHAGARADSLCRRADYAALSADLAIIRRCGRIIPITLH